MCRQFLTAIFLILLVPNIFAAVVSLDVEVGPDETVYRYDINFQPNEIKPDFSFEKPKGSQVLLARDSQGSSISYKVAGDFIIVETKDDNNRYQLVLVSRQISKEVYEKNSFSSYSSFSFPVDQLNYTLIIPGIITVTETYPRTYKVSEKGEYIWEINAPEKEQLILLSFEGIDKVVEPDGGLLQNYKLYYYLATVLLVISIMAFVAVLRGRKQDKEEKHSKKSKKIEKNPMDIAIKHEDFETTIKKYLTSNEQEVARVVKENDGISQFDILNFLPHLSKSNLSKIITKLHSSRFLNRIRVGKINKIYIGEKLQDL